MGGKTAARRQRRVAGKGLRPGHRGSGARAQPRGVRGAGKGEQKGRSTGEWGDGVSGRLPREGPGPWDDTEARRPT